MTLINTSLQVKCPKRTHFSGFWLRLMFIVFFMILLKNVKAQDEPQYDEILVYFNIQGFGGTDIPAVIRDEDLYLPVADVFNFLKIRNVSSADFDSITGFFLNVSAVYSINYSLRKITYKGTEYKLKNDEMVLLSDNLYLKSDYFGQVFGLECSFSFRSLSVLLKTKEELPVIREIRQQQMRSNISKLKGDIKADTVLKRRYPGFHLGMADWNVVSTQEVGYKTDTRINLALGSVIAGGEANAFLVYNSNRPFTEKEQQYHWRYVNNNNKYVKQIVAGKIATGAISSIYAPVIGAKISNNPTTYRRSFGSYTLSDKTEPGWTVELYVNNIIVDYVVADASGFFSFEVPLIYGNSSVELKFYGPWGEEQSRRQNIRIPFNFLPKGELQYTLSGAMVEDSLHSIFSRGIVSYGLGRSITVGGGTEYLSSVVQNPVMPFVNASVRLASSVLVSGEVTYGVRASGLLSYRLPSNILFDFGYTQYKSGQKAINNNYLSERKAMISVPIRTKRIAAFSRLTVNQILIPETRYTTSELLFSGSKKGVSVNFTTYGMFFQELTPYIYSNLAVSFRLPKAFILTPQAQYDYKNAKFISVKCGLEKHVFRTGYLNFSYEKNFQSNMQNIEFGVRFDLSFTQLGFTARNTNNNNVFIESARGSFIYDRKSKTRKAGTRISVGTGGAAIKPFLDLNCNGKQDIDEPKVAGLNIRTSGGRVVLDEKDTLIRIFELEPYTSFMVEFDKNSFDNISWQVRMKNVLVEVDPNQIKLIEVPVAVYGEASGMVFMDSPAGQRGQGRILVCFYNENGKQVGRTLTEPDGYFSFLGLPPGKFTATIDSGQLKKINLVASPASVSFEIERSIDGDIKDDFEFKLKSLSTLVKAEPVAEQKIILPVPEKPVNNNDGDASGKIKSYAGNYAIQVGAFKVLENAIKVRAHLILALGTNVFILEQDGMYKVIITGFDEYAKAKAYLPGIKNRDYSDAFVIGLKEASGMVYQTENGKTSGLSQIVVVLYNELGALVDRTRSDADGYFSFKGIPTGRYIARIDSSQLRLINMVSSPDTLNFEFERNLFTVAKTNLEFRLSTLVPDKIAQEPAKAAAIVEKVTVKETKRDDGFVRSVPTVGLPPLLDNAGNLTDIRKSNPLPGTYAIQAAAYLDIENARKTRSRLIDGLKKDVFITEEDGMFKLIVIGFDNFEQAEAFLPVIRNRGFVESFVVRIK